MLTKNFDHFGLKFHMMRTYGKKMFKMTGNNF